ncbi:MAG: S9 family peptidase [Pseudomonadota bacterium]|nr:S9 family peptidase [Pseudomonadota bacterium]
MTPPRAARKPHRQLSPFGERDDPYHWLRDDARSDPEVIAHLEAENTYFAAHRSGFQALEDELYAEMLGRIEEDDSSPPLLWHGDWYYSVTRKGAQHPIEMRRRGSLEADAEVLLDPNVRGDGLPYYEVGHWSVSGDGRLLAWAEDCVGRRQYTLRFRDLVLGIDLPDAIPGCSGSLAWAADHRTLLYVRNDPDTLRSCQVLRHVVGGRVERDALVYEETDPGFYTDVHLSTSERYLIIGLSSTVSDELRVLPARNPRARPRCLARRRRDFHYEADHIGQRWVIRTDWRAPDGRLAWVPEWRIGDRYDWRPLLPARPGRMIESFELFDGWMALEERQQGLTSLRLFDHRMHELHRISPHDAAGTLALDANPDPRSRVLRYSYSSPVTPEQLREFALDTRNDRIIKEQQLPSGYDRTRYAVHRLHAPARDGASIPITLLTRADHPRDGSAAVLAYGYGAYGHIIDAEFRVSALSLADRGVGFAILHIRGGEDLGKRWYDEGRLLSKPNSFHDFIDASAWLVSTGWAAPDRLCAEGGSAGGLLMGAVANLRPDLYRAMVLQVPFLDCLSTMEDASLPLTTNEYDEWGNPSRAHHHRAMARWSPYDNLRAQAYPRMLVTAGLHDSQVQYWEPVKWVARLRDLKTDPHPVLLQMEMTAGHGGPSGRYARLREVATDYAFLLDSLGIRACSELLLVEGDGTGTALDHG